MVSSSYFYATQTFYVELIVIKWNKLKINNIYEKRKRILRHMTTENILLCPRKIRNYKVN